MCSTGDLMLNQLCGSGDGGGGGGNACLFCIYRFMVLVLCLELLLYCEHSKALRPIIPEIAMEVWYLWNLHCGFLLQQANRCSTVLYLVNNRRQFDLFLCGVVL